jgi:hypothetical protein
MPERERSENMNIKTLFIISILVLVTSMAPVTAQPNVEDFLSGPFSVGLVGASQTDRLCMGGELSGSGESVNW